MIATTPDQIERGNTGVWCELAENLVLRMLRLVELGAVDMRAIAPTMRCPRFRNSLSLDEMVQMVAIQNILMQTLPPAENSLRLVQTALLSLCEQPFNRTNDLDVFEDRTELGRNEPFDDFIERHNLHRYPVFIQEYAGSQKYITLGAKKK